MYVAPYTRPVRTVQWEVLGVTPHIYSIAVKVVMVKVVKLDFVTQLPYINKVLPPVRVISYNVDI